MLWVKSFHIVFVVSWFAGLFYLPRIFVNLAMETDPAGVQRLLLSWGQIWQQKGRDAETIRLLTIDPHSPNEFRCNQIVRNIDEFYAAFDVTESDALWLDEDRRVTIW